MQLSNIPGKLVLPWATSGNKNTIPVASQIGITAGAASLTDGFPPLTMTPVAAGGVPPAGQDMNGILYEMSNILRWANAGGGYAYDSTFASDTHVGGYPKGARVMRSDGTGYWLNTVENNTTDPEAAGAAAAGWVPDYQSGATGVEMSGSSVTLTPAQYGKPLIVISGNITSDLNLIFPEIVGSWLVINKTSGGFAIICKTASGVGVTSKSDDVLQLHGDGISLYSSNSKLASSINNLRAISKIGTQICNVLGYDVPGDGGGGLYWHDSTDNASSDNGGTIIVGMDGARWKLFNTNSINVKQFGVLGGISDDAPALNAAVASFGANPGTLVINGAVTLNSDVTLPANIRIQVESAGRFVIQSGNRLFVNGPFVADKSHQCFDADLLATSITADINGNALNVSAASASVLSPGQIVIGADITIGTTIANNYGNHGSGQYSLNNYNGVLASDSMIVVGAAVVFGSNAVSEVWPEWFGAVADGVTDCTDAIQHAVNSVAWGGTIKFSAGTYLVTSSTIIHGGQQLIGMCVSDTASGSPPPAITKQTYIYTTTDNESIFVLSGRCNHTAIRNISFGAASTPFIDGSGLFVPVGSGRKGVVLNGHAPQFIFDGIIENCYFYNLQAGIQCQDTWAPSGDGYAPAGYYWSGATVSATQIAQGNAYQIVTVGTTNWAAITGTVLSGSIGTVGCLFLPKAVAPTGTGTAALMPAYHDWGVNPYEVKKCQFAGCAFALYINSSNADAWRIVDCVFIIPPGGSGWYGMRAGYQKLDNCFAFGASQANTEFVHLIGNGLGALDMVTLDNCQAEFCSHFINYSSGSTTGQPPIINVRNCIHQLGADVYLGSPCEYNTQHTEIQSFIYVDSAGVAINSINDQYFFQNFSSGPTWGISVVSGDANSIKSYIPGKYPASNLTGPIFNGLPLYGTTGTVTPVGNVVPSRLGQEYLNTTTGQWYKSIGLGSGNWVLLN